MDKRKSREEAVVEKNFFYQIEKSPYIMPEHYGSISKSEVVTHLLDERKVNRQRTARRPWHPNVPLMLYFRLFNGIAYAARSAAVFDAYLQLQYGGNRTVGLISSLSGIAAIVTAPLAGVISDSSKYRRSGLLRICAILALGCTVLNYLAVSYDSLLLVIVSSFLWRAWYEFVFVVTESLFTDSIPYGSRSEFFVYRRLVTTLANGIGPLISLSLFWVAGNYWTIDILHTVLRVGTLFSIPQTITLWFWEDVAEDENTPTAPSKPHPIVFGRTPIDRGTPEACGADPSGRPSPSGSDQTDGADITGLPEERHREYQVDQLETNKRRRFLTEASIPWLVFLSHTITFAGAGMTVKYFPLFFKQEYGFQPIHTCMLSSVYTVFIAGFTFGISAVSRQTGRAQASLLFTFAGICGLFILSQMRWLPAVLLTYLIRGGFQNASTPIDRSIMMDYIHPQNTGKWTALQSVATMSWSVSALFGGMLADVRDYRFTFLITGTIYLVASAIYLPCLWLVPPREGNYSKLPSPTNAPSGAKDAVV